MSGIKNVLFLCTGNSARSILAEAILNRDGEGRFRAHSAGSQPKGEVHPLTLDTLSASGFPTDGYRSKSWDEFGSADGPHFDFIFTVCDSAAGDACPVWPGQPITAHWGIPDPAAAEGSDEDKRAAFRKAFGQLHARIATLVSLPLDRLDPSELRSRLDAAGRTEDAR